MKALFAALLVLAFAPQDKITFTSNPKTGDVIASDLKTTINLTISMGGNEFTTDQKFVNKRTREITATADGKVTGCTLDVSEDNLEMTMPMQDEPMKKANPLNGKKATAKLVDGKTVVEGEGLSDDDKKLVRLEDRQDKFFPKGPIGVGETWELKGDELKGLLKEDDDMKAPEGKATFTLKEIKEIDKRRCAVVTAKIQVKGTVENKMAPMPVKVEMKLDGDIVIWIDRGYVLSRKLKGDMTVQMGDEDEGGAGGSGKMSMEYVATVKEK